MDVFSFWKESSLLSIAKKEVIKMLEKSKEMYIYSVNAVFEKHEVPVDIYKYDQELNKMQIDIRKKVLEHLSISPAQDISFSLTLINLVVDIERVGDYSKNLLELAQKYPEKLTGNYVEELREIHSIVLENFSKTINAYTNEDKEIGKEVMETHANLAVRCEDIIDKIIDDEKIGSRMGIILVLLARYLKRVSAHLKNVASSVVNPFYMLGYKPEF